MAKMPSNNMFSNTQPNHQRVEKQKAKARTTNEDVIIVPPCARGKRKSKYYTRPVFKEPRQKPKLPDSNSERSGHRSYENERRSGSCSALVKQLRNEAQRAQWETADDLDVIQPSSRTRYRIKTIVGNQTEAIGSRDFGSQRGLEGRLLKTSPKPRSVRASRSDYIDSSASVATCSNLDRLEAKRLSMRDDYEMARHPSDLSSIRREVTKLVGDDVTPSPLWKSSSSSNKTEGRDEQSNLKEGKGEQSDRSSPEGGDEVVSTPSGGLFDMFSEVPSIQSVISDITKWTFQ